MDEPILVARFSYECIVYLTFHPCSCGDATVPYVRIFERLGRNVAIYEHVCECCGKTRRVEFVLGDDDEAPSTLVDAGQWLIAAEQMARQVSGDLRTLTLEERSAAVRDLQQAVVALEEALKFVESDTGVVAPSALFSPAGRALHSGEPGRFRRTRIEAVLATYREALRSVGK